MIRLGWAIKTILRDKANFEILEGFLSELLRFDIKIVEVLESEGHQELGYEQFTRLDLLAKMDDGQLIIVEVQNEWEADYIQRLWFGVSNAVVEHAAYANVKKVYSVSIFHFNLGEGEDYLYHGTTKFIGLHTKAELQLVPKHKKLFGLEPSNLMRESYIVKVPAFPDKIHNTIDEWIYFLKNEDLPENFQAKGLSAAKEKLDVLKMTNDERIAYKAYLNNLHYQASMTVVNYREAYLEGEAKGHEKGQTVTQLNIARNMLTNKMDPQTVAEMTGLSLKTIETLI